MLYNRDICLFYCYRTFQSFSVCFMNPIPFFDCEVHSYTCAMACCALAASGTIDRTYRMHRVWRSCWTRNHKTYSHFVNRKRIVDLINQFWRQILPISKPCFPQSCLSEHTERVISYDIMYFRLYLNPSLISMCSKQHTFSTLINTHNLAMIWEDPRRIWIKWRYNGVVWSTNHNSIAAVTSPCCKPKNDVFLSDSST